MRQSLKLYGTGQRREALEFKAFAARTGSAFNKAAVRSLVRAEDQADLANANDVSETRDATLAPVLAIKSVNATRTFEYRETLAAGFDAQYERGTFNKAPCIPAETKRKLHEARMVALSLRGDERAVALANVAKLAREALKLAVVEAAETAAAE